MRIITRKNGIAPTYIVKIAHCNGQHNMWHFFTEAKKRQGGHKDLIKANTAMRLLTR